MSLPSQPARLNYRESFSKRPLRLEEAPSCVGAPTGPHRSLFWPIVFSVGFHTVAAMAAAFWFHLAPGDLSSGDVPVIEVSVAAPAPVESDEDASAEIETPPPPMREADPVELTEIDSPPTDAPHTPEPETTDPSEFAEPASEDLLVALGPSVDFPEPEPKPEPTPPKPKKTAPKPSSSPKPAPTSSESVAAKPKKAAPKASKGSSKTAPPRPLSPAAPNYPAAARKAGREGTTWVMVVVKSSGALRSARVHRSAGDSSLDNAALACVKRWRFEPGYRSGEAVEASALVKISFRLD
ncbi:MAG: TonB family protein [Verrucomicrobiae bacterium]|nr:TonB family protein [Verrucomicrobiae bacterium]